MIGSDDIYFTHLHVHSQYSLLEGTASVEQLVARASKDGMQSLALTDTHALYGAVTFRRACMAVNIHPLIGMSLWLRSPVSDAMPLPGLGQLVLLAKDGAGYRSLSRLSSAIQTSRDKTAVSWELLKQYHKGLIAIDASHAGWTSRYIRAGQTQTAVRFVSKLVGLFEEDGYLGLAINEASDERLAQQIAKAGQRFGAQTVALQPVYCLDDEIVPTLRLLAAIDQNCLLEDVPEERLPSTYHPELCWQSPLAVAERFATMPEAVTRVEEIVEKCGDVLPDGRPIWPKLGLPDDESEAAHLEKMAKSGLDERYGPFPASSIRERLEKELGIINQFGFAPIFVLVADITRFARETAVPFNTRGSVANSLVAYCIGITTVDPIEHELLFERFLNPARANMPDIDLDFCSRRRDEVLRYVRQKYGEEKVALVATVNTLQPKSAVRETAKAHGLAEKEIKALTVLLPRWWHPDPERRAHTPIDEVLAKVDDPNQRDIVEKAFTLIGQPHHMSIHPGGVVIAPTELTDFAPVQMAPKGFLITQYDHRDVEAIGLPKLDLLGIRALTVLADTAVLINQHTPFDLQDIPAHDGETAVLLQNAGTIGVFQSESTGAQRTLRQLKAKNVADLAVANAFFKPGPASGGMAQAFIRRYRGEEAVTFLHPTLEPILSSTKGVMLFQEQILRIATEVASLSWQEADLLRRGMSKFEKKTMARMRQRFVAGCQQHDAFTADMAEMLWQQVIAFAGYGFNKGHATAYADISYRSAYLKAHYPAEFLAARLMDHGGFHHQAIYIAEAQRLGLEVLPPHVNFSQRKFTLKKREERREKRGAADQLSIVNCQSSIANGEQSSIVNPKSSIYMGLGQVRELRRGTVREIVAKRPFTSLNDLLLRVPMQTKEARHLIQCGALDGLGESRAAMLAELEGVARAGSVGQLSFGFGEETAIPPDTLAERLAWEKQILGMPISANPIQTVADQTKDDVPLSMLHRLKNMKTTIAGTRLPGWTGGKGFYFGDGETCIVAQQDKSLKGQKVNPWEPLRLTGFWREDEWGGGVFRVTAVERIT